MICPNCGSNAKLTFKAFGGVCPKCVRTIYPPRMTLADLRTSTGLWNVEAGKYEPTYVSPEFFKTCSWIIRTIQNIHVSHVPKTDVKIYHLEYHGSKACLRYPDYKFFDPTEDVCNYKTCGNFIAKFFTANFSGSERSYFRLWAEQKFSPEVSLSACSSRLCFPS